MINVATLSLLLIMASHYALHMPNVVTLETQQCLIEPVFVIAESSSREAPTEYES